MVFNRLNKFETIKKIIDKYEVVSFDIFDTLIKRDCNKPIDLFKMMELYLHKNGYEHFQNFSYYRIEAEKKARKVSSKSEITLEEIYEQIQEFFSESESIFLKNLENEFELNLCNTNFGIKDVYDYCLYNKKKIIITSDMYLNKKVIEKILEKNGYIGYDKLFLSSDLFLSKQDGSLYNYILKELKIDKNSIIHIGDNKNSDYIMAKKNGFNSILIRNYKSNILINRKKNVDFSEAALHSFINNHKKKTSDFFYDLGYEANGPLLYGFSNWLHNNSINDNVEKLFFLARDGKVIREAYLKAIETPINNTYMYGSRRSLIVPMLWKCNTIKDIQTAMYYNDVCSIKILFDKWGLNVDEYIEILDKYSLNVEKKYIIQELFDDKNFIDLFYEILPFIKSNSYKEYQYLVKYLVQIGFEGNVGIVDIGWFGNMQKALKTICKEAGIKVNINGYYVGYNYETDSVNRGIKAKGFLFDYCCNYNLYIKEKSFNNVFEVMFSTSHGSVKNFFEDKNTYEIVPVFEELEYTNSEFEIINSFQKGAMHFIKDITKEKYFAIEWTPNIVFQNYCNICISPNIKEADMIGNIKMKGDEVKYLANPLSLKKYLKSPSKFVYDYKDSMWKIGFLKRVFKVNFPYYQFLNILRKIKNRIGVIR